MVRNLNEKGGINVYTVNLIENILKQFREDEFVIIYNDEKFLGKYSSYSNVKEFCVKSKFKMVWDQIKVPRILKRENVEVIFNPKLSIPLFTKAKKVLMIHGAEQFAVRSAFPWHDRIYVQIFMPLYSLFADKILTATKCGVEDLTGYFHFINKKKFTYVHEGVHERFRILEQDKLNEVKIKYNLPDKYILFISGLTPLKNFGRAMHAFDVLAEKYDYSLIVTGFRKFKFVEDMEQIEKVKHKEKIKFCGFVPDEDLPAFYNLASLYLFPSLYEGFGLPVLEAFACGCPVVTTKTGCTKEVTGNAALLADPYDINDIAEKMESILTDINLREDLISKGFERVKQFSWKKSATETMKIFHSFTKVSNNFSIETNEIN